MDRRAIFPDHYPLGREAPFRDDTRLNFHHTQRHSPYHSLRSRHFGSTSVPSHSSHRVTIRAGHGLEESCNCDRCKGMLLPSHPHQSRGASYRIQPAEINQHESHRHQWYDPSVSLRVQARFTTSSHDREAQYGMDPHYLHPHHNRGTDLHDSRHHSDHRFHRDSHSFSSGQDMSRGSFSRRDDGYHAQYLNARDLPPPYSLLDNGTPLKRFRETDMVYDDNGDPIGFLDRIPR